MTCLVVRVALQKAQVVVHSSTPVLDRVAATSVTVDEVSARRWQFGQSEYPDLQLFRGMTRRSEHPATGHFHTS